MKFAILILSACLSSLGGAAENVSNDSGHFAGPFVSLTPENIAYRFHVTGEVFVTNETGDRLLNRGEESRDWQFGSNTEKPIVSNWLFQQAGLPSVALRHEWSISKDGEISVLIQQYDNIEMESGSSPTKLGKLIREQKFVLKDFAPVNWVIQEGGKHLVVRFTPELWTNSDAIDIGSLPISGKNVVIYDTSGKLWGTIEEFSGIYFAASTLEGTIVLSYRPFKGAQLMGEAKEGRISIKSGKTKIYVQSEHPFLPRNVKAKVYGLLDLHQKTERLNSVRTVTGDKEEDFLNGVRAK